MKYNFIIVLLVVAVVLGVPSVRGQSTPMVQIPQFTVSGMTNSSIQLAGSSSTGVQFNGVSLSIYNTYFWQQAYTNSPAWVIYLVGSSSDDFQVAYLYLQDGGTSFTMYFYDYNVGEVLQYWFTGTEQVSQATSMQPTVQQVVPTFNIQPKYENQVDAQGSQLSIQGNTGVYDGNTVDVIWNYIGVSGQWNEIWTVSSNYHFIIFYTYYNQPNSVTVDDLDLSTFILTVSSTQSSWNMIQPSPLNSNSTQPVPEFPTSYITAALGMLVVLAVVRRRRG